MQDNLEWSALAKHFVTIEQMSKKLIGIDWLIDIICEITDWMVTKRVFWK